MKKKTDTKNLVRLSLLVIKLIVSVRGIQTELEKRLSSALTDLTDIKGRLKSKYLQDFYPSSDASLNALSSIKI